MSNTRQRRVSKSFKRMQEKLFRIRRFPALLGNAAGIIDAGDGFVFAIIRNGQTIKVVNNKVPKKRMKIWLGYDENNPERLQVLGERFSYGKLISSGLPLHWADTHAEFKPDMAYVSGNQYMPLLATVGATDFSVKIFGATFLWLDGSKYTTVLTDEIDVTDYIPTAGAVYCLIQTDSDGVLSAVNGTSVSSPELLLSANYPLSETDKKALWAVRLYTGQDRLHKDNQVNDFIDLRASTGGSAGSGGSGDMLKSVYDPRIIGRDVYVQMSILEPSNPFNGMLWYAISSGLRFSLQQNSQYIGAI